VKYCITTQGYTVRSFQFESFSLKLVVPSFISAIIQSKEIEFEMQKKLSWAATLFGGFTLVLGVTFIAMYVLEAVVKRIGDPDRSLIFWYLLILFLGVSITMIGFSSLIWGVKRLRGTTRPKSSERHYQNKS
jgi:protein-S-isoprenylcysteine O-methyltransferase Ste14